MSTDHYHSLWRNSANEAVAYSEDFPEALLVYPELLDGARGQGNASKIITTFDITDPRDCILKVTDNGTGISSTVRLKKWSSKNSTSIQHRYGHGSKKCLTKFAPNYETAKWKVSWRTKDKKGVSSTLKYLVAPFVGETDNPDFEDEDDETTLMPSGTEWEVHFDLSILKDHGKTPKKLMTAIKEIILTRFSRKEHLSVCEFEVVIIKGTETITENSNSNNWKTFEECLNDEVETNNAYIKYQFEVPIDGGKYTYTEYNLSVNGSTTYALKKAFPFYGRKNQATSRVHIGLNGRYIEAMPYYKFIGKEQPHNDYNGTYVIVNFTSDKTDDYSKLPTPCTTKVKFQEDCAVFKSFLESVKNKKNDEDDKERLAQQERENEREKKRQERKAVKDAEEKAAKELEAAEKAKKKADKAVAKAIEDAEKAKKKAAKEEEEKAAKEAKKAEEARKAAEKAAKEAEEKAAKEAAEREFRATNVYTLVEDDICIVNYKNEESIKIKLGDANCLKNFIDSIPDNDTKWKTAFAIYSALL
jgi:hypothetical protein